MYFDDKYGNSNKKILTIDEEIEQLNKKYFSLKESLTNIAIKKSEYNTSKSQHYSNLTNIYGLTIEEISDYYLLMIGPDILELNSENKRNILEKGKKSKISKINFKGDRKIRDRRLRDIITSQETKFWKVLTKNTNLNESNIALDKRLLTNYYKKNITIKKPNDLLINKKKISGILQEIVSIFNKKFLIIGIGINIIKSPKINNYPTTNLEELTNKTFNKVDIENLLSSKIKKSQLYLDSLIVILHFKRKVSCA